jgi:hypothetical protein
MTKRATVSDTDLKTCSANSKTGGESTHAAIAAPTPFSQQSASQPQSSFGHNQSVLSLDCRAARDLDVSADLPRLAGEAAGREISNSTSSGVSVCAIARTSRIDRLIAIRSAKSVQFTTRASRNNTAICIDLRPLPCAI